MPSETISLLDRLARTLDDASDYRVAKILGVSRTTVSNWRVGKGSFSDNTALKIADLLNENPGYLLAVAAAERATSESTQKAWRTVARRLQRSAAAFLVACVGLTGAHSVRGADGLQNSNSVYYVK